MWDKLQTRRKISVMEWEVAVCKHSQRTQDTLWSTFLKDDNSALYVYIRSMILAEKYVVISILIGQHVVLMITWFVPRFIMRRNPLTAELLIFELAQ